jgi:nucleotide-binding universal stress UspA family protein
MPDRPRVRPEALACATLAQGGFEPGTLMSIDNILVAVSFSERSIDAVRKAASLAADHHAGITLLHVVEPVKRHSVRALPDQQALLRARVTHARKELARFAGEIAARDRLPVAIRIEIGEKVASIAHACAEADVLFIGGTNMKGFAAALHRSTAERLIGKCGIPILVVNGPHAGRCARALVPVDGAYESVPALRAAARLWPDAELTLLHAMDTRQEQVMRIHDVPLWAVRRRQASRMAKGLNYLKALAARAQVSAERVAFRVAFGDASRAVLSMQAEMNAQVVVMMKRKTTALADFILGSTVRRLLPKLQCDVLLTPEQTSSPVVGRRFPGETLGAVSEMSRSRAA